MTHQDQDLQGLGTDFRKVNIIGSDRRSETKQGKIQIVPTSLPVYYYLSPPFFPIRLKFYSRYSEKGVI